MRVLLAGTFDDPVARALGAKREAYERTDQRTARPELIPAYQGRLEEWYEKGRNHRLTDRGAAREVDSEGWFLHVDRLEDLVVLLRAGGTIGVVESPENILEWMTYD